MCYMVIVMMILAALFAPGTAMGVGQTWFGYICEFVWEGMPTDHRGRD